MFMRQYPVGRFLPNEVELSNKIHRGWVDTARWLRNLIVSKTMNLDNRDLIEQRLNKTAEETAMIYSQYYGPEVGNRIKTSYLSYFQHVKDIIEAYLYNDDDAIKRQQELMYKEINELTEMLAKANRYWDRASLQALFYPLVDSTENQIASIVAGDYLKDIESYDNYFDQAYRIADELTHGILKQFQI